MSLYNKEDDQALEHLSRWQSIAERASARIDAERKANDPLSFYWSKGVRNLRDQFGKLLDFKPKPEDFYDKDRYNDGRRISHRG